jgi:hypothetical protein
VNHLLLNEVFGFIKPSVDIHTLGVSTMSHLLIDCGYRVFLAPRSIEDAVSDVRKLDNFIVLKKWIINNGITRISFSYRLDPREGKDFFCNLYYVLKQGKLLSEDSGLVRGVSFAGLPDTCELIKQELGDSVLYYPGDETPVEALMLQGVPKSRLPKTLLQTNSYDRERWNFAENLIASEKHKNIIHQDHYGYKGCGTKIDSYERRLEYCRSNTSLPIIRAHVGPYQPNRVEAVEEFLGWTRDLAATKLLDVLSIGTSQLTQSNFAEDWGEKPNGGGVPINSELEYRTVAEAAFPMLVRTYAGTKNVPDLARIHERALNISWHALSFWWFCEIDGRGANTVLENLREHFETVQYIASTNKPLEPNIPHHFAFRGADDITYIITGYLAAKMSKKLGIRHLILQNMLNTPKHTWGVQDLAKSRAMLKLVKELEDASFSVSLQSRAGLDYFSPDLEKAKVQLASVTALMDDIDANNEMSPEIIHVVSYSEAVRLATPPVIKESIQITLAALKEYRMLRKLGKVANMAYDVGVQERSRSLYEEAKESISLIEDKIPNLYTAEGFYYLFNAGFFPVPYLLDKDKKYSKATNTRTAIRNGGVYVVNDLGEVVDTPSRYSRLL